MNSEDFRVYESRVSQAIRGEDGVAYGSLTASNDDRQFRIVAAGGSPPYGHKVVWFTDRAVARGLGRALLEEAEIRTPSTDHHWEGDDGTPVRVAVAPATPMLHIGDRLWPLDIDDAIDLAQRLIAWADLAL